MPIVAKTAAQRRKVKLPSAHKVDDLRENSEQNRRPRPQAQNRSSVEKKLGELDGRHFYASTDPTFSSKMNAHAYNVPDIYLHAPIKDTLQTPTSKVQEETILEVLPWLNGSEFQGVPLNEEGVPLLEKEEHAEFLHSKLRRLPPAAVFADASRPWLLYWSLTGLSILDEDVAMYQDRVVTTLAPLQNTDGGFGGGHGHLSHGAATYAAVLSLVTVGGDEALGMIDRRAMWKWMCRLKQPDGGFTLSINGEEDVRGAFCALCVIALLGLPLELTPNAPARQAGLTSLVDGLPEWLARCQTFEGGISGAPGNEAHGGYAFCALGALSILGSPHEIIPKYLDIESLVRWLSGRQHAVEGGYSGRTNKLVDGCYSWWVGGCWPIIEAAVNGPISPSTSLSKEVGCLYNREGLLRYILSCCQEPGGGLRDKPSKHPDGYHSCYVLAGLSAAQHTYYYSTTNFVESMHLSESAVSHESDRSDPQTGSQSSVGLSIQLPAAFGWAGVKNVAAKGNPKRLHSDDDVVQLIHPIFVVPWGRAEKARAWFERKASL